MTELDAPQEGYALERKLTCINVGSSTGQCTEDNEDPGANLLITFDRETIDEVAALNSFSNSKRGMGVEENSTFGSTEISASPIEENCLAALYRVPGIAVNVSSRASADLMLASKPATPHPPGFYSKGYVPQEVLYHVRKRWSILPHRFVWSITIAGHLLRIWRWSSTGCMVTEAILYEEDVTFVYIFLRAIAWEPYSRLGVDIGPGKTFSSSVEKTEDVMCKMDLMVERHATRRICK